MSHELTTTGESNQVEGNLSTQAFVSIQIGELPESILSDAVQDSAAQELTDSVPFSESLPNSIASPTLPRSQGRDDLSSIAPATNSTAQRVSRLTEDGILHTHESVASQQQPDNMPTQNFTSEIVSPNWRRIHWVAFVYLLPTAIALIVALIVDRSSYCPLQIWAIVQVIVQILLMVGHCSLLLQSSEQSNNSSSRIRAFLVTRFMNFIWIIWFTVGVSMVFQPKTEEECAKESPYLYKISLTIILLEMGMISLTVVMCCCSFCVLWVVYLIHPSAFSRKSGMKGADKKDINELTELKVFDKSSIPNEDATCAICLEEYNRGDEIRFLQCKHHFHSICVDKWLNKYNRVCPFCKSDIETGKNENLTQESHTMDIRNGSSSVHTIENPNN